MKIRRNTGIGRVSFAAFWNKLRLLGFSAQKASRSRMMIAAPDAFENMLCVCCRYIAI